MYVKRSSFGPIVTFVTTAEFKPAIETVYGLDPPVTSNPVGWHVCSRSDADTFGVTFKSVEGVEGKQLESPSAGRKEGKMRLRMYAME